jgi:hypothetical protein
MNVVFVRDRPLGNVLMKFFKFLSPERRDAAAAGHTSLVG